jgi:parallel beta-helix repeat protein
VAIKFPSHGVDNPDYEFDCGRYAKVLSRVPEIDRGTSESRGFKEQRLLRVVIGMFIVAVLLTASLSLLPDPSSDIPLVPVPAGISYTTHTSISINGDAQFNNTNFPDNGVVSGNGSASDPFIIEGWEINARVATGIDIRNTNAHFVVRDCHVYDGRYATPFSLIGISLWGCANGTISNNNCSSDAFGVSLRTSINCTISNNNCSNGIMGVYIVQSSNGNTLTNNTCLSNTNDGIEISASSGNHLVNNTCSNNGRGIYLGGSSGNTVSNNTCSSNTGDGICLGSSSSNTLRNNSCLDNGQRGIWIIASGSDTIAGNQICNNTLQGIYLQSGSNYRIWNNKFIGNNGGGVQASDDGTNNWWNTSGSPHGYGNWWSDLTTPDADSDGIVDWSYNLTGSAGAKDYYPQTTPSVPIPEFGMMPFVVMVLLVATMLIGAARRKKAL